MANRPHFKIIRVQGSPIPRSELLEDLRKVAAIANSNKVTQKLYRKHGKFDCRNLSRRFGTWNQALTAARLAISNEIDIPDERLYENLLVLWQHYGRQPRRAELSQPPSKISQGPYRRRFRTWIESLESFATWANSSETLAVDSTVTQSPSSRQSNRSPSLRLRFKVMLRDHFICRHCGSSPAKGHNVELHVDHVLPWSQGGETTLENLQTLCSKCNLGKGSENEIMN